jgi:hypothetical protein
MEKLFEQYIAMTIDDELKQLAQVSAACAHRGRLADPARIRFSPLTLPSKSIETLLPILNLSTSTSTRFRAQSGSLSFRNPLAQLQ